MTSPRSGSSSRSPRQPGAGGWPVAERSAMSTVLGVPPLAATGIALVLTALGVFVDILRIGTLGWIYSVLFFVGCVLAAVWVRRCSLFWPMVQPPLLMVVVVPVVVLLVGTPAKGVTESVLLVGAPLVNGFPTLAATTAAVLLIGALRLLLQREGDEDAAARSQQPDRGKGRPARREAGRERDVSGRRGSSATRAGGRTSGSPRRS